MALDINGYNSAFKSFVEFAQNRTGEKRLKNLLPVAQKSPVQGGGQKPPTANFG